VRKRQPSYREAFITVTGNSASEVMTIWRYRNSIIAIIIIINTPQCGSVAEWLGNWTCNQQVLGSNPGHCNA